MDAKIILYGRAAYSKSFFVPLVFLLLMGCAVPQHTISISNESGASITLERIDVDEKEIFLGQIKLEPRGEKCGSMGTSLHRFYLRKPKKLKLIVLNEGAHAISTYSCNLEYTKRPGCVFKVSFGNDDKMTCTCSVYSDFSN